MPCPRTQQANLPACSPQPPINAERQAGKLRMPFFKVFWYDSTREMNPKSSYCKADALTTTPSRRFFNFADFFFHLRIFSLTFKPAVFLLKVVLGALLHDIGHLVGLDSNTEKEWSLTNHGKVRRLSEKLVRTQFKVYFCFISFCKRRLVVITCAGATLCDLSILS